MEDRIAIFDTTLRDGEQSPGISLGAREKLEIAEQLQRLGVDIIEAGFPATSQGDFNSVRRIASKIESSVVCALARAKADDIDRAWDTVRAAARPRIHTFISTSDIHLEHQLHMTRGQVLDAARSAVAHARSHCQDVEFSPMDATRSEPAYLYEVLQAAIEEGATVLNIPDTVGYSIPGEFEELVRGIIENVPGIEGVTISVHCHNDLGLAVANSLAACEAGARQVECAVNGLGERAGNASLEEIVMALKVRHDRLPLTTGINSTEISKTSRLVSLFTGYPVQPNKAIVGKNAFAHESGIHQDGVLKEPTTYEIMDAVSVGLVESDIVLGKHSGRHALSEQLERLGYYLSEKELNQAFARFKELADKKSSLSGEDIEAVALEYMRTEGQEWKLTAYEVHSGGKEAPPSATVTLESEGVHVTERAIGDGMIDAMCKAIREALGIDAKLHSFAVEAITGGLDALGDVTVQLDIGERRVVGRGLSTDVVEASARAYLNAVNKVIRKKVER
ncbi:MAG: 2-isopropylmalate synthase [Candidatus Anoxymicrobium japonicum]|uniref:2-isopropylmalate synthase n=1 Tax=Candidatus Anoxymicrobium japonicum TaxID=2013648 RepID=A0A2N3G6Z2_9ACTN|nr:MAG: 2-isopropylmalate synthase [Candidatus Anoxymicrobium japonicum]